MIGPTQDDIILVWGQSSCQSRMIAFFGATCFFQKQNQVYHPGDHPGSVSHFPSSLFKSSWRHPSRILHGINFFHHPIQKFESSWRSSAEATNRPSSWHHPGILLQLGSWFKVILASSCHPGIIVAPIWPNGPPPAFAFG